MLDSVNADNFFPMINPIKDAPIPNAEFAETGQIFGHSHKPAMHHDRGIFGQPDYFAFNAGSNGRIEFGKLYVCPRAYFDPVGHDA